MSHQPRAASAAVQQPSPSNQAPWLGCQCVRTHLHGPCSVLCAPCFLPHAAHATTAALSRRQALPLPSWTAHLPGLGFVYSITKNPSVEKAANAVYEVWAKYRTQLTGREALGVILQRRRAEGAGGGDKGSLCTDEAAACEVPAGKQ